MLARLKESVHDRVAARVEATVKRDSKLQKTSEANLMEFVCVPLEFRVRRLNFQRWARLFELRNFASIKFSGDAPGPSSGNATANNQFVDLLSLAGLFRLSINHHLPLGPRRRLRAASMALIFNYGPNESRFHFYAFWHRLGKISLFCAREAWLMDYQSRFFITTAAATLFTLPRTQLPSIRRERT